MRTRPYQNNRIIAIIQDLYFMGGSTSFASQFDDRFPVSQDSNGVSRHEVPIPMVALAATAVSCLSARLLKWWCLNQV